MTELPRNLDDNKSDHDLWNDILEGNIDSLGLLYKRYYIPLFLFGKKVSDRHDLAEDSVQDLFFKIWKKRENLGRTFSTRSYIYAAYRRLLLDKIKLDSKKSYFNTTENQTQSCVQELIINNEINSEQISMIKNEIDKLPARQKEIIFLRFFNGLNYQEIAEILNINYQSVRNSIHKALTTIRKSISIIIISINVII